MKAITSRFDAGLKETQLQSCPSSDPMISHCPSDTPFPEEFCRFPLRLWTMQAPTCASTTPSLTTRTTSIRHRPHSKPLPAYYTWLHVCCYVVCICSNSITNSMTRMGEMYSEISSSICKSRFLIAKHEHTHTNESAFSLPHLNC